MKSTILLDFYCLRILHEALLKYELDLELNIARCAEIVRISIDDKSKGLMIKQVFLHDQAKISEEITDLNIKHYREQHLGLTRDREEIKQIHKTVEDAFKKIEESLLEKYPDEGKQ